MTFYEFAYGVGMGLWIIAVFGSFVDVIVYGHDILLDAILIAVMGIGMMVIGIGWKVFYK